ncbi:hypothetical protein GGS21DRAFT_531402 [Xylaria nigripes]|nr:hypothetical protein GGS21DRAFT_531402 [Xylaria nigripes]
MVSPLSTILVVGATGQQGGAVLAELSHLAQTSPSSFPNVNILALTRNSLSKKAQHIKETYGKSLNLEVIEGDTRDPDPIFAGHPNIDGVFSFTTMPVQEEEAQAMELITASAKHGVKHFVFSSVDRGGDDRSWENPTDIPHFVTKHNVEHHLRNVCTKSPTMTYTILRPVAFMDNLNPTSGFGSVMAAMWATMPSSTKLQIVSVRDIGVFAVKALLRPSDYASRAIGLAGDELTLLDLRSIFRKVAGTQLPQVWTLVGYGVRWISKEMDKMFTFFEDEGYGVDIEKLRAEEPRLQDFETWLKESSTFECGKGRV